jgi:hypothetical protein
MARSSFVIDDSYFDDEGKLKESEVLEAAYLEFDKLLKNFGEFWGTGLTTT